MAVRGLRRDESIEEIKRFMHRAPVEEAILCGSRARGDHLRTSDVDLTLISPRFEGTRPYRRLAELHQQWDASLPFLEVLAYTPEEFAQAKECLGIDQIAAVEGNRIILDQTTDGDA